MTHTPGPWKIDTDGLDWPIVNSKGHDIAVVDRIYQHGDSAVNAANARLIAAAPQTLAACEQVEAALVAHQRDALLTFEEVAELLDILRAAIAQAKGE